MRFFSAAALVGALAARHGAQSGTVSSLSASAEQPGRIDSLEAMAFRGFSAPSGKLQAIKATSTFRVAGEDVAVGDVLEVPVADATSLVNRHLATLATDANVIAAQQQASKA